RTRRFRRTECRRAPRPYRTAADGPVFGSEHSGAAAAFVERQHHERGAGGARRGGHVAREVRIRPLTGVHRVTAAGIPSRMPVIRTGRPPRQGKVRRAADTARNLTSSPAVLSPLRIWSSMPPIAWRQPLRLPTRLLRRSPRKSTASLTVILPCW